MNTIRIIFGPKFCQLHLDEILSSYWEISLDKNTQSVVFDLSLLEWINTEEIAFLFAWIRYASQNRKKEVSVCMPYPYNIYETDFYTELEDLKKVKLLLPKDDPEKIERRQKRSLFLMGIWGMLNNIGIPSSSFLNLVPGHSSKVGQVRELFSHLVIPFTAISAQKPSSPISNTYADVIAGLKTKNRKDTVGPFDLNDVIIKRLEESKCYSPFESKIISHVITKELFANSLIHSNLSKKNEGLEECYFALSLHQKWDEKKISGQNFILQFTSEKDKDTLDFYKDKRRILQNIQNQINSFSTNRLKSYNTTREADLSRYEKEFKNESFLEFTFLDFGDGIHNTLQEKFSEFRDEKSSNSVLGTDKVETRILEYAFLAESSRNQYDARLEQPELFPRGLYFLVDMVRRYKGLLIVRSGKGKLIYDFSDKILLKVRRDRLVAELATSTTIKEAIRLTKSTNAPFEGTLLSIVLPQKLLNELSYAPVRADIKELYHDIYLSKTGSILPSKIFEPQVYEYISLLFLYERVITSIKPEELEKPKGFDSYIYIELLFELKRHSGKKCVVFIDFELYPRTDNIQQMLFYLTNSPYVNEYCKVVIINLRDDQSKTISIGNKRNFGIISEFKVNLFAKENQPHIFRPIPCANFDMSVPQKPIVKSLHWIGVKESRDEEQLSKLFLGETESLHHGRILDSGGLGGNVFADNQENKYAIFTTGPELVQEFKAARHNEIVRLIGSLVSNGMTPATDKKGETKYFIFQASKGSFQLKYLSLYETLHNKYLAHFLAKRLLDKYLDSSIDKDLLKFNKIITVTVSSQLIGVAIRDLIKDEPDYESFKTGKSNTLDDCPSLIMLSSYYSFEDEKPFARILENDRVLIVNDVISTGSLVHKLIESIECKKAIVSGVMSIVDCRVKELGILEEECLFKEFENHLLLTLVGFPNEKEIEIRKYKRKEDAIEKLEKITEKYLTEDQVDIRRINPLLNTVVELSNEHAEKQQVLFEDPIDLLPKEEINRAIYQSNFFRIGHFEQNTSHNSYLTNMKNLFLDKEGYRIVESIKKKMDEEYQRNIYGKDIDDASILFSIISMAGQIQNKEIREPIFSNAKELLKNQATSKGILLKNEYNYRPDFIFYPIFSGIENFSHSDFHEIFQTDYENIIGLQRFDTDKGWRFPFPPKRFNNITKGKRVLILDSGALTGESLIQMIDSISFLEVAHIDVISVIGRVEDYNREFFSRMRSLKVKSLHGKHAEGIKISFSNLNIIFGINLHIPVFPSRASCPFCDELNELSFYQEKSKDLPFPTAARRYIEKRKLDEIKCINPRHETHITAPSYIPYLWVNGQKEYDIVSIFMMRDKLGKIDSYRFYKEYYKPFDDDIIKRMEGDIFQEREVLKQIELILICILHEPKLFKVHKDLLVNVYEKCKYIIESILKGEKFLTDLTYVWKEYSIVQLALTYFSDKLHTVNVLEMIFNFASENEESLDLLSYTMIKMLKPMKAFANYNFNVTMVSMDDKFRNEAKTQDEGVYRKMKVGETIRQVVKYIDPVETEDVNQALYNLKIFFVNEYNSDHDNLVRLMAELEISIGSKIMDEDLFNISNTSAEIWRIIDNKAYKNILTIRRYKSICPNPHQVYINLIENDDSVYNSILLLGEKYTMLRNFLNGGNATFEEKVSSIEEFKATLFSQLRFKHFLLGKWFNNFCNKYLCYLEDCIRDAIDHERVKTLISQNSFNIQLLASTQTKVNAHYDFLVYGFKEIIINAAKRVQNKGAVLEFKILNDNDSIKLFIVQDKPFILNDSNHYSGIENDIKPIFEMFCGKENVIFPPHEDKSESFVIEIIFNKLELKIKK